MRFTEMRSADTRPEEWRFDDGGLVTKTSIVQDEVLELLYTYLADTPNQPNSTSLNRVSHMRYLLRGLDSLPSGYVGLDASQPWLLFWIITSITLMGHPIKEYVKLRAIESISKFQNPDGGFGGGNQQVSHLAATYAAIHALVALDHPSALDIIDRDSLYRWLMNVKQEDGSFLMCLGGEVDIRGSYCAISCASLLNLLSDELCNGVAEFIIRCQNYDGGLGCYPGVESHGGYTYCGLATLQLLNQTHCLNFDLLVHWSVHRQMALEGGFQGRTNKLVDGCYSFWVGSLFPIIQYHIDGQEVYSRESLEKYILKACQAPSGGLRDKPGKGSDYYHTCYVLSGLSLNQHHYTYQPPSEVKKGLGGYYWEAERIENGRDTLIPAHPLFNLPISVVKKAYQKFWSGL